MSNILNQIKFFIYRNFPPLRIVWETMHYLHPVSGKHWFRYFILRKNRKVYWPTHPSSTIWNPKNILVGVDCSPGKAPGCYIQGSGKVYIGSYTGFGPNVGVISSNHSIVDYKNHSKGVVKIGKYCWVGMNSVILPNVTLGDRTIVRAGSTVVDSFPDGYCVIGGNPAVLIKQFPFNAKHLFNNHEHENKYIGFIKEEKFAAYRKQYLEV